MQRPEIPLYGSTPFLAIGGGYWCHSFRQLFEVRKPQSTISPWTLRKIFGPSGILPIKYVIWHWFFVLSRNILTHHDDATFQSIRPRVWPVTRWTKFWFRPPSIFGNISILLIIIYVIFGCQTTGPTQKTECDMGQPINFGQNHYPCDLWRPNRLKWYSIGSISLYREDKRGPCYFHSDICAEGPRFFVPKDGGSLLAWSLNPY